MMNDELLDVRNLSVSFHTDDGVFKAVDNVSLHVKSGEIVGLVGESGCGKSVTSLSILRLIPSPPGKINSGQVIFKGDDLLQLEIGDLRRDRRAQQCGQERPDSLQFTRKQGAEGGF